MMTSVDATAEHVQSMADYRRYVSRYSSCLRTTEQRLLNGISTAAEDRRRRDALSAQRIRDANAAFQHGADCLDRCAQLRRRYGIGPVPVRDTALDDFPAGQAFTRLAVALDELRHRAAGLDTIEARFDQWQRTTDRTSRRLVAGAVMTALATAAGIAASTASTPWTPGLFALLALLTVGVTAAGLGVAVARRLPAVCTGPGLARVPAATSLGRLATAIGAVTIASLVTTRLIADVVAAA